MLVLSVNAVEPQDIQSPLLPADFDVVPRAYAFLLTAQQPQNSPIFRIETAFSTPIPPIPTTGGEVYFDELIRHLREGSGSSVEAVSGDIALKITLVKES